MMINKMSDWLVNLKKIACKRNHRVAIILSGERGWGQKQAQRAVAELDKSSTLWVSAEIEGALSPKKARSQLGNEVDAIVFDAYQEFDPDAFGAVSGTLRGGGIFIVLTPSEDQWSTYSKNRFMQRALSLFKNNDGIYFLKQGEVLPEIRATGDIASPSQECHEPFRTREQQQVVSAIEKNALDVKPVPLVITSDRGRGKSSALGLAAGHLLQQGIKNIIVTAPRLTTSDPLFRHARQVLPGAIFIKGELSYQGSSLKYVAPDALLEQQPEADLLLVDEAAAIPLPMLEQLSQLYPHVVFASTIHGYEGTGRGFALKFNKVLDAFNPDWQLLTMQQPIRWAEHDPVEQWVDRILCLDADLSEVPDVKQVETDKCSVNLVNRDELINDEKKLSSLFSLLVYAHYRTQPSDFQHMLDDDKVRIYTLEYKQQILAAVLINEEGGFDSKLSSEIYRGERRPSGHLLAQTLTFHAGCESAATICYARIMRIAVHPNLQGSGLGSGLLGEVVQREIQQGINAVGSSFGATVELLRFWKRAGFELVRMGFTRDHASGTHSAVMLKSFDIKGENVLQECRNRFQHSLSDWLLEPLSGLPEDMQQYLQTEQQDNSEQLTKADWQDINSFINTHRGYEACMCAVRKLVTTHTGVVDSLDESSQELINARIVQRLSWAETVENCGLDGKAQALQQLRMAVEKIVKKLKE